MRLLWEFLSDGGSWSGGDGIGNRLLEHVGFTVTAMIFGALIALPVGALIGHTRKGADFAVVLGGVGRVLPAIGILVYVVLKTDVGNGPVSLALVLVAIPPMLSAAYAGVRGVDRRIVDAARGMGMQPHQVLLQVELPGAAKIILGGVRTSALLVISTATVAAYVKAGGLGRLIVDGLAANSYGQMAAGAVLVAALAVAVDLAIVAVGNSVISPGLTGRYPARAAVATKGDLGTAAPLLPETAELVPEPGPGGAPE